MKVGKGSLGIERDLGMLLLEVDKFEEYFEYWRQW